MPKKKEKQPLSETHPELAKEADGWDPADFVAGSHKKMSWKCSRKHTFQSTIEIRTKLKTSCPICEGRVILTGFNDLKTLHPRIAKESDGWDPSAVGEVSNRRFQWKCSKSHTWKSTITSRVKGFQTECPKCFHQRVKNSGSEDLKSVFPVIATEAFGWDPASFSYKSAKKVNWKCPKGHLWACIIKDRVNRGSSCPVCSGKQLLVGVTDLATTHPELAKEANGWDPTVFQKNSHHKLSWKCRNSHIFEATVISRTHLKSGCPICSGNLLDPGKTDLASTHPKLAKELLNVDPTKIKAGSHKTFDWQCPKGHQYRATAHYRQAGHNCPICAGKRVQAGFNDLATTHPELAAQADGWDPTTVNSGSNKFFAWKCIEGHQWKSVLYSRLTPKGVGCPFCSGKKILIGFNDLATTHPDLASEAFGWDPKTVNAGSNKKVKWKCNLGHITSTLIYNRTIRGDKCPVCSNVQLLPGFNDLATVFPALASEAYGFDPTKYISGSNTKVKWKCKDGHKWITTIGARSGSKGTGCPTCAKTGYDPNADGYLYFLTHPTWEMLQIGITNIPDDRLSRHKRLGWEVLELRGPMDGHLAQQWETAILQMLKAKGADLSNAVIAGKFDGYSEAWSKSTFEAKSIKELMRLTEEFESNQL